MLNPVACGLALVAFAGGVAVDGEASFDGVKEFDDAVERARAVLDDGESDLAARRAAARQVGAVFLRIPLGTPGRLDRIVTAAEWSLFGQRSDWAQTFAEEAVRTRSGGDRAFVALWRAGLEGGDPTRALREVFEARETRPLAVRDFVFVARGLAQGALFAAAAARLRDGETELGLFPFEIAAQSGSAIDRQNLALSHRFLGRLEESRREYEAALELAPDDDEIWNDYGICLKVSGDLEAAIDAFERSVEASQKRYGQAGQGPGLTNLAVLSLQGRLDDPERVRTASGEIVSVRPTGALARRLYLDALLGRNRRRD